MTIQSFTYLLFVAIVWGLYRLLRGGVPRELLLLAASYLFYASWGLDFLALLIFSSAVNYGLGEYIRRKPESRRLWVAVGFNLLVLAFCKYLPSMHVGTGWPLLHRLIMPVGVSFWTFEALSYHFDLYREEALDPTPLEFCLYLAFWPTVLSGPVCRLPELLPQFREAAPVWDDIAEGARRILVGLFMKVVLAQILASGLQSGEGVDAGFDQIAGAWGGLDVWALAFGYGFQLFFDFAGYSNIVIGTGRLFGIRLAENFNAPYFSSTVAEFWTRWHMSLSFWIRDYVFLPLATAKRGLNWRYFALFVSMVTFGFWHGATVLYVLWGAYHGVLLVGHRQFQALVRRFPISLPAALSGILSWGVTFPLVCLGWILFRAGSPHQAGVMFRAVLSAGTYRQLALRPNYYLVTMLIIAGYFVVGGFHWVMENWANSPVWRKTGWLLSPLVYSALIVAIVIWSKQKSVFVYLQF